MDNIIIGELIVLAVLVFGFIIYCIKNGEDLLLGAMVICFFLAFLMVNGLI